MICRTCLRRAAGLTTRPVASQPLARRTTAATAAAVAATAATRNFTTTLRSRNAAPSPAAAAPATASAPEADSAATPDLTPLTPNPAADGTSAAPRSSCLPGTVLNGLNFFKGKTDPVALPDEAYPAWLWNCLEVQKKADSTADADAGDEFSKSKKQRRLALKRQRAQEARMLASGDLEALVPKVPLHKQSVNLPAAEPGNVEQAVEALDKREELRRAMRKERRAKIKESNYLKAM